MQILGSLIGLLLRTLSIFALLTIISLTGCANVASFIKARQEAIEQNYVRQATISCKRYGFTENTTEFSQCIQNEVISAKSRARDAARNAANSATIPQRTTTSCTNTYTGMDCTTQ